MIYLRIYKPNLLKRIEYCYCSKRYFKKIKVSPEIERIKILISYFYRKFEKANSKKDN